MQCVVNVSQSYSPIALFLREDRHREAGNRHEQQKNGGSRVGWSESGVVGMVVGRAAGVRD